MSADLNLEGALRRLIGEIDAGDSTDRLGQALTANPAFRQAQTLLDVHDVLSGGPVDLGDGSIEDALRALVAVCGTADYQGRAGAPLPMAPAFRQAAALAA